MFSIQKKDGLARIGALVTDHGRISTPIFLPVINPNRQMLHPDKMVRCGAEAFITNAYLVYRDPNTRKQVLEEGLHKYIDFEGPLMTDSGAFQLMEYGEVSITNQEITQFQEQIGSDIGVFLDIPTKSGTLSDFNFALDETLKRADEHIRYRNERSTTLWAGPIQGGKYLELVKKSCEEMGRKKFHIHPIGSVVPLLEKYDFENVLKMILTTKMNLPLNRPIHLFGAGHPMFFALAVFLGVDIFDSAAYFLYAKKNRYITSYGTIYLENLDYLPCSCEICQKYTADELKQLSQNDRTKLLALHNLTVSFEEIKRIRQAINEGRLYHLVLTRTMNHPSLAKNMNLLFGKTTSEFIELYETTTKPRSLLVSHPILVTHPLLLRYRKRILERFYHWSSRLVIINDYQKLRSSSSYQILRISPIFGVIPDELRGIYPLVQYEKIPMLFSSYIKEYISKFFEKFFEKFSKIEVHPSVNLDSEFIQNLETFERTKGEMKINDLHILNSMLDYQFGTGTHEILRNKPIIIIRSRKTGILRRFSDDLELLGTFRPSDFTIVPTKKLAQMLHQHLSKNKLRVVAEEESVPFIQTNKDLLAKFVYNVDPEIRSGDEVLIVNKINELIGFGKSLLSAEEMKTFDRGVAVRVRK